MNRAEALARARSAPRAARAVFYHFRPWSDPIRRAFPSECSRCGSPVHPDTLLAIPDGAFRKSAGALCCACFDSPPPGSPAGWSDARSAV